MLSRKKKTHKRRKILGTPAGCPWNTRRDKQGSAGQCSRDFLLFAIRKLKQKGIFAGTPEDNTLRRFSSLSDSVRQLCNNFATLCDTLRPLMCSKFLDRKPNLRQKCNNAISATRLRHFVPRIPSKKTPLQRSQSQEFHAIFSDVPFSAPNVWDDVRTFVLAPSRKPPTPLLRLGTPCQTFVRSFVAGGPFDPVV